MPVHLGTTDWEDERNRNAPRCPECGAPMRIQVGPYGEFYGCSRFPDCRGKVVVENDIFIARDNGDIDIEKMIKELYG